MGADSEAVAEVYVHASHAALTDVVGRFRSDRKLRKLLAGHRPSPKDEETVALRFSMPTGDLRRMGYDLRGLSRDDENQLMQDLSAAFCRRFTTEYPELRLDPDRLTVLCWLSQVSGSDLFDGTNSLRAALEEYAKTGDSSRLKSAVGWVRKSMEAMGSAEARALAGEVALGEDHWQVRSVRLRVTEEMAKLEEMLERARPVLEEHGLAHPDLFPER